MVRLRAAVHGLVSLLLLVVTIVGVPAVLLRWGQLQGTDGKGWWDQLRGDTVSDSTVFAVLTAAAWAAWAIFAVSVVVETVAGLRGVRAPHISVAGPLQRLARGLVVPVLVLVTLAQQSPVHAARAIPSALPLRGDAATVVVDVSTADVPPASDAAHLPAPPSTATDAGAPSGTPGAESETVVVELHDNPWRLAERHLGDGMRWRELFELNRGVPQPDGRAWTDPEIIVPGWRLRLPADIADAQSTATDPTGSVPATPTPPDQTVHVVGSGDTLTGLAARYLGDPSRYGELFDANRDTVQPDGRRLTNPNLIVVGWRLAIPTEQPTDASTPTDVAPTDPAPLPAPPATAPLEPTRPADTTPSAPPATTPQPADPPPTTTAPTPPTAPSTTTPATAAPTAVPSAVPPADTAVDSDAGRAVVLALLAGATAAATGLALRLRWLRRRRATRDSFDPLPSAAVEDAARAAANEPLVRWAGQELAKMIRDMDRRQISAAPVAIELSEESGIEVLWDDPQRAPAPAGWSSADGGWAWRHAYDAEDPTPPDTWSAPIPALVTIGQRDGRQLLIDLEAFGVLQITGPADPAKDLLRSIALELSCANDLADAYVTTVGLDLDPAVAPRHRLQSADVVTATAVVTDAARSVADTLAHSRADDTFIARVGETAPLEATVIVADQLDIDSATGLAAAVAPRRSVAVVTTAGLIGEPGARLVIDPSGAHARLEPLGLRFEPVGFTAQVVAAIEDTVRALHELPPEPSAAPAARSVGIDTSSSANQDPSGHPGDVAVGLVVRPVNDAVGSGHPSTNSNGHHQEVNGQLFAMPSTLEPKMMVRVLGVPRIDERPEIGRRELILAVLLACRGSTLAATTAQDALWGGKPVEAKTVWNFVAAVRRSLGEFEDRTPVMPAADRSRSTLRLDPRVTTDLAVLRAAVTDADGLPSSDALGSLRSALELVEGPPFDAAGYDWAHRDQDVSEAARVIQRGVDALVELALSAGEFDIARDGVARGLRGLPGDEHLYRIRMRVESTAGNHAGIVAAYDELCVYLADLETQPSPVTTALYHELKRQPADGALR